MAASDNAQPTRRRRWRRWRRTRPFWGGLLLILAGVELLFIPLIDVFMRGAVGIVMHMGIGGVSGVLIGAVLAACGLLLWFDPAHRIFYAVIGTLGGVLSFPATNFGGFFLGLLLGIIGGSLAFGWTEIPPPEAGSSRDPGSGEPDEEAGNSPQVPGGTSTGGTSRHAARPTGKPGNAGAGGTARTAHLPGSSCADGRTRPRRRPRLVAAAGMAAIVSPLLLTGRAVASTPAAPLDGCVLIFCPPSPAPSPSGTGSPSASPGPSPAPSLLPPVLGPPVSLGPGSPSENPGSGSPSDASGAAEDDPKSPSAAGTPGLKAYTAPLVFTMGRGRLTGFAYQGVTDLPVAGGRTVRMMKFTVKSFQGSGGVRGVVTQGGHTTVISSPSLALSGDVVWYATKLSAKLLGVPLTLTPGNAQSVLLHALKSVTPAAGSLTLTDIVANQPIIVARSMQGGLAMTAS